MKAGRIPQAFIDDLLERTDIVDVVGPYVQLRKSGANHSGACPFHEDRNPSFSVGGGKQCYHCFACGASGNAITFLVQHGGLSFVDAVSELARAAGMPMPTLADGTTLTIDPGPGLASTATDAAHRRRKAERAAEEKKKHDDAARQAVALWRLAVSCINHPYATRKAIHADVVRLLRLLIVDGRSSKFYAPDKATGGVTRLCGPLLLAPMLNVAGDLRSTQAIDKHGRKSFLKGSCNKGLFLPIKAPPRGDRLTYAGDVNIVEGLATGAAAWELSNAPTFVAFSAGNLKNVAHIVRGLYPRADIIVCGDVDRSGAGQQAAKEAAAAVGGLISLPPFTADELATGATDWNDWARAHRVASERMAG